VEQRLAAMRYKGEGDAAIHLTQLSVTASLMCAGWEIDPAVEFVIEATRRVAPDDEIWDWEKEEKTVRRMCEDWLRKHPRGEAVAGESASAPPVEPVDLWANFDPPPLPRGLLPKVVEDYAFTLGEMMGADPAGLAMAALTVCAAAISDDVKLQMKKHSTDWQESARLWFGAVGPPSCKKSPAMAAAAKPLRRRDAELLRQYHHDLKLYKELTPDERKATEQPPQKRLCLEDTTIEAAQEVLAGSPGGVLLFQDELSGFFGSMDKYSGSRGAAKDRGFWLESWNGRSYAVNRVGRGAGIIPNLSVSMMGGIQPEVIRKIAAEAYDDGFLQRMILIMLRPAVMGKDVPAPPVADAYARLVERLTELAPPRESFANLHISLSFEPGAQALRQEMERKHLELTQLEAINKKLASHISKYDGYFGRLCLLWHCIEHAHEEALPPDIAEDTARRVADFMHHFMLPHALAFYAGVLGLADEHDRLAAVAGYILAHKLERVTNRDIARGDGTMRKLTRRDTEGVFEQLEALGWVAPTPGPRTTHWVVNCEVHKRFADRAAKEGVRRSDARALIASRLRATGPIRGGEVAHMSPMSLASAG
jgi:hypothetical protein